MLFHERNLKNILSNIMLALINFFERYVGFVLRIGVSLFLLLLIFRTFSVAKLVTVMLSLDLWWVIFAMVVALLRNAVSALRWKTILDFQGLKISFQQTYRAYLESYTFSQFLPTSIGGDVRRGWVIRGQSYSLGNAYSGLLFERIVGQFGLAIIGFTGILGLPVRALKILSLVSNVILLLLFGFFFVFLLMLPKLLEVILIRLAAADRAIDHLKRLINKILIMKISLYSMAFQFLVVLGIWSMSRAANIPVPLLFYMGVIPVASLVSLLPISINGWGIREGVYYYFLYSIGINTGEAAIIALLFNLPNLFLSLVGIISFWRGHQVQYAG
ncbi:MAG: lysylphosphatidylglycerol synthase transmembrane domain-containing protein [Bacteroidales bacterium]